MLRIITDPPQAEPGPRPPMSGAWSATSPSIARDGAASSDGCSRPSTSRRISVDAAGGTPETATASREFLRRVEAAVAELPEPTQTAFRLHRVEGVPQFEIAKQLGVSRALVCGLVRRGHLHCLAALDRRCADCPAGFRAHANISRKAEAVRAELGDDAAREHAIVAEERRKDQQRRDQRQPCAASDTAAARRGAPIAWNRVAAASCSPTGMKARAKIATARAPSRAVSAPARTGTPRAAPAGSSSRRPRSHRRETPRR